MNHISKEEYLFWKERGFLKKDNFFESEFKRDISKECYRLEVLPDIKGKWMKYYEYNKNIKKLARIEKFIEYSVFFEEISKNKQILSIVELLLGERAVLLKDKINFKYPNTGYFAPHQDAPAFNHLGPESHITVMITIDDSYLDNGCIHMAKKSYTKTLPIEQNGSIKYSFSKKIEWQPIECNVGDIVIFNSYVPHFSNINKTNSPRRALFLTYTYLRNNDKIREKYFLEKRKVFPPEYERDDNFKYTDEVMKYNLANPIK